MKKLILYLVLFDLILFWLFNIISVSSFKQNSDNIMLADSVIVNDYHKDNYVTFVQESNKRVITNKQDIINIIYTVLNNGYDEYQISCSSKYANCVNDINNVFNNKELLNVINNIVSPYNSFDTISANYIGDYKFKIDVKKIYTNKEIDQINKKITEVINNIQSDIKDSEKIKIIHDYIINNSNYDVDNNEKSKTAYGVLFNKQGQCTGYADTLALFLDKLDIPNYRIVNDKHVWNVVYLDNNWYHIDVTFDAPLIGYNDSILRYDYFLLSSNELSLLKDHEYNQYYYNN